MSAAPKIVPEVNPLFDKKLLQAFVDGALKTLATIAQTEAKVGKPHIETRLSEKCEIAGMVGMVAPPLKGTLLISFTKESIFQIMENMLGEKHTEISNEISDAVGELTNMIYGTAKTALNQMGYNFEMAIPTVIRGEFTLSKSTKGATLVIPFELKNNSAFHIAITVQT
ncbi:MAG TPA: chemotaxis protein CheX [Pseudobdellovibrionaceae bacterium]|jgi:chemotaxis protein CheX